MILQAVPPPPSGADTAWLLASTALVLLMTPALAFFYYGGLVRRKNVLNTMMMSFVALGAVGLAYFVPIGFTILAEDGAEVEHLIALGGCTDWTRRLRGRDDERLVVSRMATERVGRCSGPDHRESHRAGRLGERPVVRGHGQRLVVGVPPGQGGREMNGVERAQWGRQRFGRAPQHEAAQINHLDAFEQPVDRRAARRQLIAGQRSQPRQTVERAEALDLGERTGDRHPDHRCRGIADAELDGVAVDPGVIPLVDDGATHRVRVVLGEQARSPSRAPAWGRWRGFDGIKA